MQVCYFDSLKFAGRACLPDPLFSDDLRAIAPLFHFAFQRAVACRVHLFQRDEFQARAVDAVAQAAFVFGAVGEDVSQVRIGGMAAHFGAAHVVAEIVVFGNGGGVNRAGETRPAAAGIEFVGGTEQGFAADDVHINAGFEQMVVFVAEGVFGCAFWVTWYCSSVRMRLSSASLGFIRCRVEAFALRAALVLPGSGSSALQMSMWQ